MRLVYSRQVRRKRTIQKAPQILLAKKPQDPAHPSTEETLVGHTMAVVTSARAIMENLDGALWETFGICQGDAELTEKALLRAALLHDLGKANSQFQEIMWGNREGMRQALRHEWMSAWLPLWSQDFAFWLFGGDSALQDLVLCAVLGHHLKAANAQDIDVRDGSGGTEMRYYMGHEDFKECLEKAGETIGIVVPFPELKDVTIDLLDRPLRELRRWFLKEPNKPKLVPIVKALLMAADIAGSALPVKRELDIGKWISRTLGRRCSEVDIGNIVTKRLQGHKPREFQCQVKNASSRVALVRAGCGSGKTVAAYMWATKRAEGRKLFLCYPTTGTATEGYRDYIIPSEMHENSALLHSRSEVDIERVLETESGPSGQDAGLGINALVSWDVPITVCTADTVLGIIQNSRHSLYTSPAFMNAAFIFDEIHQYDSRLWRALLRFLEAFKGTPVLLMTASLPVKRREALATTLDNQIDIINGPAELEEIERYALKVSNEDPWPKVKSALAKGKKVLWVCNTVSRCVEMGRIAESRFGTDEVLPYHSRFRYIDRLKHHNKIIKAFKSEGAVLAVTTQVYEVSLDISADLLVTDLAPIPALIQRLGRLNRRARPDSLPCDAIIREPSHSAPYDKDDLEDARRWLRRLAGRPVSQKDLAREFEALADEQEDRTSIRSEWLDGGKFSGQAPLREAGYTIPVVREEDLMNAGGKPSRQFIVRHEIPMLLSEEVSREMNGWRRTRHVWIAPSGRIDYDERWGAKWAKK